MDSEEDDCGDLYAGLDDQVNAGITAIGESHSAKEFDSTSEECCADERAGEAGERQMGCHAGRDLDLEADDSESEDELHIVLNEEDGSNLPTAERCNGGMGVAWCEEEEDEDEDLVIVTGSEHHQNNSRKHGERLSNVDELKQRSAERVGVPKVVCNGWCVGSHMGGFHNKLLTSLSERGEWDQLMPSSSGVSTSCNSCISPAAQTGCHFSLPRKRSIFDINIEAFEQKPWRQQCVDITDYFNFDLNEESWKTYCQNLDQIRQQAKMSTQFSVDESSRLSQVLKLEQRPSTVNDASDSVQFVNGETVPYAMDNLDKGLTRLEMSKGRAIQVEHGIGERIPSMDTRRPRHRDSVVIQVTMEESIEDGLAEESRNSEKQDRVYLEPKPIYDNGNTNGMLCLNLDGLVGPAILSSPKTPETNSKATTEAVVTKLRHKIDDTEDPSSANGSKHKAASHSAIQANNNSGSSDSDSHYKASKDLDCSKKMHSFVKKFPMNAVTRSRESSKSSCYYSNGSRSNIIKSKEKDWKCNSDCLNLSPNYYRDHIGSRHDCMVASASCEEASVLSYRTSQNGIDTFGVGSRTREGKHDSDLDVGGYSSFDYERRKSRNYKSRIYAEKHLSVKSSTRASQRKGNHDTNHKRHLVAGDCSRPKSVASEENETAFEDHFHRWYHDEREIVSDACEDSNESILKYNTIFLEKDPFLWHQKRKVVQDHFRIKDGRDVNTIQHRYREQNLHVVQRRPVANFIREGGSLYHKSDGHVPLPATEIRNSKRRYNDTSSCSEMDISNWYIEHDAIPHQRDLHGAISPREYVDQKQSLVVRDRHSRNKGYGNHFPNGYYHGHSSYKNDIKLFSNEYRMDERGLYSDENVEFEFSPLTTRQLCSNDEIWLEHREQVGLSTNEGSFKCAKNSRNEKSHVNQYATSYSDDDVLVNDRKKIFAEESAAPMSKEYNRFVLDNFDKRRHELGTLEHQEAVNLHLNGLKRKHLRQGNLDTSKTGRQSNTQHQGDKKARSSRPRKRACRQGVASCISKLKRSHQHAVSLDAVRDFDRDNPDDHTMKKCQDKKSIPQNHEDDEIEEGQLIEEPDDQVVGSSTKDQIPMAVKPILSVHLEEKNKQSKESTTDSDTSGGYYNKRILETLAKMKKRLERFKEPIAPKRVERSLKLQHDVAAVTDEVKQQRPARKRRWGQSGPL
ncbi:unnamed protein product [Musa acuminata subsp. burmannicoides]